MAVENPGGWIGLVKLEAWIHNLDFVWWFLCTKYLKSCLFCEYLLETSFISTWPMRSEITLHCL